MIEFYFKQMYLNTELFIITNSNKFNNITKNYHDIKIFNNLNIEEVVSNNSLSNYYITLTDDELPNYNMNYLQNIYEYY